MALRNLPRTSIHPMLSVIRFKACNAADQRRDHRHSSRARSALAVIVPLAGMGLFSNAVVHPESAQAQITDIPGDYYTSGPADPASATNDYAFAIGSAALSDSYGAFAIGARARATEYGAVAIGFGSESKGISSMAIGQLAIAGPTAINSLAIGIESDVSGPDSVAIGYEASAGGWIARLSIVSLRWA